MRFEQSPRPEFVSPGLIALVAKHAPSELDLFNQLFKSLPVVAPTHLKQEIQFQEEVVKSDTRRVTPRNGKKVLQKDSKGGESGRRKEARPHTTPARSSQQKADVLHGRRSQSSSLVLAPKETHAVSKRSNPGLVRRTTDASRPKTAGFELPRPSTASPKYHSSGSPRGVPAIQRPSTAGLRRPGSPGKELSPKKDDWKAALKKDLAALARRTEAGTGSRGDTLASLSNTSMFERKDAAKLHQNSSSPKKEGGEYPRKALSSTSPGGGLTGLQHHLAKDNTMKRARSGKAPWSLHHEQNTKAESEETARRRQVSRPREKEKKESGSYQDRVKQFDARRRSKMRQQGRSSSSAPKEHRPPWDSDVPTQSFDGVGPWFGSHTTKQQEFSLPITVEEIGGPKVGKLECVGPGSPLHCSRSTIIEVLPVASRSPPSKHSRARMRLEPVVRKASWKTGVHVTRRSRRSLSALGLVSHSKQQKQEERKNSRAGRDFQCKRAESIIRIADLVKNTSEVLKASGMRQRRHSQGALRRAREGNEAAGAAGMTGTRARRTLHPNPNAVREENETARTSGTPGTPGTRGRKPAERGQKRKPKEAAEVSRETPGENREMMNSRQSLHITIRKSSEKNYLPLMKDLAQQLVYRVDAACNEGVVEQGHSVIVSEVSDVEAKLPPEPTPTEKKPETVTDEESVKQLADDENKPATDSKEATLDETKPESDFRRENLDLVEDLVSGVASQVSKEKPGKLDLTESEQAGIVGRPAAKPEVKLSEDSDRATGEEEGLGEGAQEIVLPGASEDSDSSKLSSDVYRIKLPNVERLKREKNDDVRVAKPSKMEWKPPASPDPLSVINIYTRYILKEHCGENNVEIVELETQPPASEAKHQCCIEEVSTPTAKETEAKTGEKLDKRELAEEVVTSSSSSHPPWSRSYKKETSSLWRRLSVEVKKLKRIRKAWWRHGYSPLDLHAQSGDDSLYRVRQKGYQAGGSFSGELTQKPGAEKPTQDTEVSSESSRADHHQTKRRKRRTPSSLNKEALKVVWLEKNVLRKREEAQHWRLKWKRHLLEVELKKLDAEIYETRSRIETTLRFQAPQENSVPDYGLQHSVQPGPPPRPVPEQFARGALEQFPRPVHEECERQAPEHPIVSQVSEEVIVRPISDEPVAKPVSRTQERQLKDGSESAGDTINYSESFASDQEEREQEACFVQKKPDSGPGIKSPTSFKELRPAKDVEHETVPTVSEEDVHDEPGTVAPSLVSTGFNSGEMERVGNAGSDERSPRTEDEGGMSVIGEKIITPRDESGISVVEESILTPGRTREEASYSGESEVYSEGYEFSESFSEAPSKQQQQQEPGSPWKVAQEASAVEEEEEEATSKSFLEVASVPEEVKTNSFMDHLRMFQNPTFTDISAAPPSLKPSPRNEFFLLPERVADVDSLKVSGTSDVKNDPKEPEGAHSEEPLEQVAEEEVKNSESEAEQESDFEDNFEPEDAESLPPGGDLNFHAQGSGDINSPEREISDARVEMGAAGDEGARSPGGAIEGDSGGEFTAPIMNNMQNLSSAKQQMLETLLNIEEDDIPEEIELQSSGSDRGEDLNSEGFEHDITCIQAAFDNIEEAETNETRAEFVSLSRAYSETSSPEMERVEKKLDDELAIIRKHQMNVVNALFSDILDSGSGDIAVATAVATPLRNPNAGFPKIQTSLRFSKQREDFSKKLLKKARKHHPIRPNISREYIHEYVLKFFEFYSSNGSGSVCFFPMLESSMDHQQQREQQRQSCVDFNRNLYDFIVEFLERSKLENILGSNSELARVISAKVLSLLEFSARPQQQQLMDSSLEQDSPETLAGDICEELLSKLLDEFF